MEKNKKKMFQLQHYQIQKTIGRGTFGKVKKAIHKLTTQPVAIKILQKQKIKDVTDVERVTRELHILKVARHSAIAQLYEVIQTLQNIYIIMEYSENGQFFDYVMDGKIKSQDQAFYYFSQILDGLQYLHKNKIAHRDIKPQNMLLDSNSRIKIVDFGLSNMYQPGEMLTTACGSPCYASPQMIKGQSYDPQLTDIWSLGIVLFAMVFSRLPFEDENTSVLYSKIKAGIYIIDKKISSELRNLLSGLLCVKIKDRLNIKQIRNHLWCRDRKSLKTAGVLIGYETIPIDQQVLSTMSDLLIKKQIVINLQQLRRQLQNNIKNWMTTTYYLLLKKNFKNGIKSQYDICSQKFNSKLLQKQIKPFIRHKSFNNKTLTETQGQAKYFSLKGKTTSSSIQSGLRKRAYSVSKSHHDENTNSKKKPKLIQIYQIKKEKTNFSKSMQKQIKTQGKRIKTQSQQRYSPLFLFHNHTKNHFSLSHEYKQDIKPNRPKFINQYIDATQIALKKINAKKDKEKAGNYLIDGVNLKIVLRDDKYNTLKNTKNKQSEKFENIFWKKKSVDHRSQSRDNRKISNQYYINK